MMWLKTFIICSINQRILEYFGISRNISNIMTCIGFQVYFIYLTSFLTYNEIFNGVKDLIGSRDALGAMYGYFSYDLLQLLIQDNLQRTGVYIAHHAVSCLMIDIVLAKNSEHTLYQNAFLFAAEASTPFLNARILLKEYPALKKVNRTLMKYIYFLCRVIGFPILAYLYLQEIKLDRYSENVLVISFLGIYAATLRWFIKIVY